MYFRYSLWSHFGEGRGPSIEHSWIPLTQWCIAPSLFRIGQLVLENIFKFCQCMCNVINLLFDYNLPLKRTCLLHLNKDESPTPKNVLCHVWLKLAQCFWREFLDFFNVFFGFSITISFWERAWTFIWTNLDSLYPRMLCVKFGWNWPGGSGEDVKSVKRLQTDGRVAIRKAHLSLQLRWTKKKSTVCMIEIIHIHVCISESLKDKWKGT